MKLHAIKSEEGDCLLLETGEAEPRYVLIDGGPSGTCDAVAGDYVRRVVGHAGTLEVVVVSHVDADHIVRILDLLAEIERDRADGTAALSVKNLWHNSPGQTVDTDDGAIGKGLQAVLDVAGAQQFGMSDAAISLFGIAEGARLRRSATRLAIPINAAFDGGTISPDTLTDPVRGYGSIRLTVIGPTTQNLMQPSGRLAGVAGGDGQGTRRRANILATHQAPCLPPSRRRIRRMCGATNLRWLRGQRTSLRSKHLARRKRGSLICRSSPESDRRYSGLANTRSTNAVSPTRKSTVSPVSTKPRRA